MTQDVSDAAEFRCFAGHFDVGSFWSAGWGQGFSARPDIFIVGRCRQLIFRCAGLGAGADADAA